MADVLFFATIVFFGASFFLGKARFLSLNDIQPVTLRLRDYVAPGEAFHLGRRSATGDFRGTPHTHDFAELFWLEQGSLTHLVNGERRPVAEGDVVFIRPGDVHTFRSASGEAFTQVNVAFERDTLDFLHRRYFEGAVWPWRDERLPATERLDRLGLARLQELAARLAAGPATRLLLERFLLELLLDLVAPPVRSRLPAWLSDAIARFAEDPDALSRGVPGLASLAGRSREHVNRVIRDRTGKTATALVNELRLNRAAAGLTLTDDPIVAVASDSGIGNLSHFYRLFKSRFGVTPRQYRLDHQSLIRGSRLG